MTFSIVGRCPDSGMLGVAIATSSICVASRCPWGRANIGAVVTQNITDPRLGRKLLDILETGRSAREALGHIVSTQPNIEYRQLTVIDASGDTAHYTGRRILGTHAVVTGDNCVAAGNLLSSPQVIAAMAQGFRQSANVHLAEKLLLALEAGLQAGGEAGPLRSAGLLVHHEQPWPLVDLRIDWAEDSPVGRLRNIWEIYRLQMKDYIVRALDPGSAPGFGVPGDS